jgi:hypothetical protein
MGSELTIDTSKLRDQSARFLLLFDLEFERANGAAIHERAIRF